MDRTGLILSAIAIAIVFYLIGYSVCEKRAHKDLIEKLNAEKEKADKEMQEKITWCQNKIDAFRILLQKAADNTLQSCPWMAKQVADALYIYDMQVEKELRYKIRPAIKAADQVKKIAKEKRELQAQVKMLEYQIAFWNESFPWLEDFREVPVKEAWEYRNSSYEGSSDDGTKKWLSPEEYEKLPSYEKSQRSLDRYRRRKKSNWEIGIEYERYIGYLLEEDGWHVEYHGALMGMEDMGIDLLASKDEKNLVIQCKRWGAEKIVRENTVCQLFGSTAMMAVRNESRTYTPVFIYTCPISDIAIMVAEYLHVTCVEYPVTNEDLVTYPCIKCNISKDGEKIYHLPFDQQYDKTSISGKDGALYVCTAKEAEDKGFRHAYRWRAKSDDD